MVRRPTGDKKPPGPLSPRRAAALAGRSPSGYKGKSREGSDGTPSMGSSFSDLDGACFVLYIIIIRLFPSRLVTLVR